MIETFIISAVIIAICFAFLCIKLLLKKDGKFSSQHIHDNQAMKDRGIDCYVAQDSAEHKQIEN